jgi:uncharacterized protein
MKFNASGHVNIRATHKTTLEFTKDDSVSLQGDCIVGVGADFSLNDLKEFLGKDKVVIRIEAGGVEDVVVAVPNPGFNDANELIVRMSDFVSERTFAVRADKAAAHLKKALIHNIRKGKKIMVAIT